MCDPDNIYHLATDGLICGFKLPLKLGNSLGEWEEETLTDLSLVQYGVYFAQERSRWRGFDLAEDDVPSFIQQIHTSWDSKWRSVATKQRLFVTSSLVASGQKSYDEWCTWQDAQRTLNLDVDSPYEQGSVHGLDRLYPVRDMTRYYNLEMGISALYNPKWGVGENFPWEERDSVEDAFVAATLA